jgi:hypothetical protein
MQYAADPHRQKRCPTVQFQHDYPQRLLRSQALCRTVELTLVLDFTDRSYPTW